MTVRTRRSLPGWVALLVLAASLSQAACGPPFPRPRAPGHHVLVTIDTLRADHLECYGYPRPTAPFVCGLAGEGVLFEWAMSSTSHTAPSHASMFTSLELVQHKVLVNGQPLDRSAWTLAEMFREQGRATAAFTAVGFLAAITDGFDHVDARGGAAGGYRTADVVVDAALAWLEGRDPREPVFLWVHLYDVHDARPYRQGDHEARAEVRRRSPLTGLELVGWVEAEHGLPWRFYQPPHLRTMLESRVLPPDETVPLAGLEGAGFSRAMAALQMDLYDGQILFVDRQVRRLFTTMESDGWMDLPSTWIVTSDHGEGLGEHDYYGHGRHIYQEQLHVPLILWSSGGRTPARRVSGLVRHVDLFPTLAELAGGTLESQVAPVQGRSLLPLVAGATPPGPAPPAYAQRRPPRDRWEPGEVLALQDGRHKYIHRSSGDDELYDLETDPFERYNLLDSADPPDEAAALRDALLAAFGEMAAGSRGIGAGEMDPAFLEELRALGYIR